MTNASWFEPPPKQETGCLKGCLFLIAFIVVGLAVLLGSIYFWGTRSHSAVARGIFWLTKIHAISDKPAAIPAANVSESQREEVSERWRRFEEMAHEGQPAEIVLSATDLNALIAQDSKLAGKIFASIDGNRLRLQLSVPLQELLRRAQYYFNAEIVIESPEPQSLDQPQKSQITINGTPLPVDLLQWEYSSRALRDYLSEWVDSARVGSFQIRDGTLILRTRSE